MGGEEDMVDTLEALDILKVSAATLYRLVDRGELVPTNLNPALRRPQKFLFRRGDLDAFLQRGRRPRKAEQQGQ